MPSSVIDHHINHHSWARQERAGGVNWLSVLSFGNVQFGADGNSQCKAVVDVIIYLGGDVEVPRHWLVLHDEV